jgi:hypothetical protein
MKEILSMTRAISARSAWGWGAENVQLMGIGIDTENGRADGD